MSTHSAQIGSVLAAGGGSGLTATGAWNAAVGSVDSFPYHTTGRSGMIVFRGMVEVEKAANGFVVRVGTRQGDISTTYVAKDVAEVNGIITAEMVKFKLEDK